MLVTIHQPNLFPWLGYFHKMAEADLFIHLDNVSFTKGGFQNRVQLKGSSGPQWLTMPVLTKDRAEQITNRVEINQTQDWRKNHLQTLRSLYGKAAGFASLEGQLLDLYNNASTRLTDFTLPGIELLRRMLGIQTPVVLASSLGVTGKGTDLLVGLVKAVGGDAYYSGPSGRNYLDESAFSKEGIDLHYHHFPGIVYPQRFGDFIPGLSTLDYVFNDPSLGAWRQLDFSTWKSL